MIPHSRITITGHKGMLGSQFYSRLVNRLPVQAIDLPEIDITDRENLRGSLFDFQPELIIHCAAYTDVDKAESEAEKAFQVNALATRWTAQIAAEIEAQMVYFSTDYVFCDTPGVVPRNEFTLPAPRGVYACSKFAGEQMVRRFQPQHFIIRTSWLYGSNGKNFVDAILKAAAEKPFLSVVTDQIGSPTYTSDLADQTLRVIEYGDFGDYHISGNGSCSWFQFSKAILKTAGIDRKVYPISTASYNAPAPRPAYSVLDHLALRYTVGDDMPHWRKSLTHYLAERKTV
ncbi:MAG: dTDP-4-dehydrorhamnose reductase [candidate division Zixibacteria bacterium]|nr:dTDP-4-dehydrorhamnose reductase [Candidatus Tariuqbacter arcticus]